MRPVNSAHLFTATRKRKKEKFKQTACCLPGQNRCAHHTGTGWKWALQNHQAGFGAAIPGQDLKVDREDCWRLTSDKYSNCNFPPKIQDGDGNVKEKRNTSNFKIMSWCIFYVHSKRSDKGFPHLDKQGSPGLPHWWAAVSDRWGGTSELSWYLKGYRVPKQQNRRGWWCHWRPERSRPWWNQSQRVSTEAPMGECQYQIWHRKDQLANIQEVPFS